MREPYETPTIEILEFDSEEVITMSGTGDNYFDTGGTDWQD